jgi:ubiquinone/menaquinone biosynthesis C-methylase UbiE
VNRQHLELLASDEWRQVLEERAFPFAFGPLGPDALGDDVLEIGPGPGLTTDMLRTRVPHLTSIELDPALAAALRERLAGAAVANVEVVEGDATAMPFEDARFTGAVTFTMLHHVPTVQLQEAVFRETLRVLRPGGVFVANDSVPSDELASFHVDDVYNPIDPTTLAPTLAAIGFVDIDVRANQYAWACRARRPG